MAAGNSYCLGIKSNDFFLKDNKKAFILWLNVPKVTAYSNSKQSPSRIIWRRPLCPANLRAQRFRAPEGGYIPNPYGRDLGLGYRVRTPSSQEGDRGVEAIQY